MKVFKWKCTRCDHEWLPRKVDDNGEPVKPRFCPDCHSLYWDTPRVREVKLEVEKTTKKGT